MLKSEVKMKALYIALVIIAIIVLSLGSAIAAPPVFAGNDECNGNGPAWGCERGGGQRETVKNHVCRNHPEHKRCP